MNPFKRADPVMDEKKANALCNAIALSTGASEEQAREQIKRSLEGEWFVNDTYTVIRNLTENAYWPCPIVHLSIRRNDREPVSDWRDMQQIKNELTHPEFDAVQIHPKESRLVDNSNQFHLWVFADPDFTLPVGWTSRMVSDDVLDDATGGKQRKLNEG